MSLPPAAAAGAVWAKADEINTVNSTIMKETLTGAQAIKAGA
ncbi:MAG: hypothetical protein ABIR56_16425 [Polaromonas sp.]